MTPRKGMYEPNDVRKANNPTIIQQKSTGWAMEFNGTDEYLQIALPSDLAVFDLSALAHGSTSLPTGWTASGTTATVKTDVVGSSKCLEMNGLGGLTKSLLTSGKKYKIKIRYKANVPLNIGRTGDSSIFASLPATSEWNTISKVITADVTGIIIFFTSTTSGLSWIESITLVEDQGFDLNKDQEQILHSNNWNFNGSTTNWTGSGMYSASLSIIDKYEGSGSLLISGSGAGDSGSNHVKLTSANLESVVSGKKYTLEGFARLDASSLVYGASLLSGDGTSGWNVGNGTGSVVAGEYVLASAGTGFIYRNVNSPNNILKITFKAKADTYTGKINVYHQSSAGTDAVTSNESLTSTYQTITVYIVAKATLQTLYIQLLNAHTGNVYFDDITIQEATPVNVTAQLGTKSVTSSALSIVAGTFTKFVLNFEATASEVSQDLKLYLSGAGSVFVDKLSLTQAFDVALLLSKKGVSANTDWLFAFGAGSTGNIGYDMYQGSTGVPTFALRTSTTQTSTVSLTGTANQIWVDLIGVIDRAGATLSYIKSNKLSQNTTFDTTDEGKVILNRQLIIGSYLNGGTDSFAGQISHIQIIRFENIAQSTFNSAITGLQYPTGGGAEEVLRLTFQDGTSIVNTLKDYSSKGHTVTGVNVDATNRKRVV